jgi:deoxyribose-phosphate aldolase
MMRPDHARGQDTPGKVRALCAKAIRPDPSDPTAPAVAAICVYPTSSRSRRRAGGQRRARSPRRDGVPVRPAPLDVKLADVRDARRAGADEIDMVIDRGAFLSGRYARSSTRSSQVKEACGDGAPQGDPRDRRARHLRQRAPRLAARDARRRRLHQDVDRQDLPGARRCP